MAKKQGINFYELGRASGATTSKTQQSGFEAFIGGATKSLEDMLTVSKAATAALTAAMPAGVPIEKVPEELRSQVTEYLTNNKKAYSEATKVVASGINPQSQRYKDAIEVINSVSTKFENLSNTLEDIALKRKQALDDPNFSPATLGVDRLTFENLQNGSLYSSMTLNEDGTFNYIDGEGTSKAWSDFAIAKQGFTGQQAYLGAVKEIKEYKRTTQNASWSDIEGTYQNTFDLLFNTLGPKGSADFAFADKDFLNENFANRDLDELRKNPTEVVDAYRTYVMDKLEQEYMDSTPYFEEFDKPEIFGAYRTKRDIDIMNKDISRGKDFIGFDNRQYKFKDGNYYDMTDDPDMAKPLTKDQTRRNNKIHGFYTGGDRSPASSPSVNVVTGTEIGYEYFGDTASNSYSKFQQASKQGLFPKNITFAKEVTKQGRYYKYRVIGPKQTETEYSDVIVVQTAQGQEIKLNFSNPDEASQRKEMKKLNDFINRYGDKPKV